MAESASFTSRSRNRLCNKAAQEAIITGRVENWAAFTRAHIYKCVNKRGRLWAHKAVKSIALLSAVASLNEDRLITLEAQIKLFKRIMRRNSGSSRQSDCKIWLKILWFYTPFPLCSTGKARCAQSLHHPPTQSPHPSVLQLASQGKPNQIRFDQPLYHHSCFECSPNTETTFRKESMWKQQINLLILFQLSSQVT